MSYRFFRNVAFAFVSLVVFCQATSVYAYSLNGLRERVQREGYSLHERMTAPVPGPVSESTNEGAQTP
ncbi:MAG: hypothetical protein KBD21_04780, partial [Candidatus Pacebacteria bacterium]|nr:hypothetical protein [Candidatus Paceibacterota bacterium]